MNPLYGPLTATQRDLLSTTGDMLALLPVPGARDLATRLTCLAGTRRPDPTHLADLAGLARTVQRALALEACPDRWLDEVAAFDTDQQADLIADLIGQRRLQADQVGQVVDLLATLTGQRTAVA